MDAPVPALWAASALFVALAVPCVYRLVLAHPGSVLSCQVDRLDEAAELLMCLGMLAMVCPVGLPVPLAGWLTAFTLASVGLTAAWVARTRRTGPAPCVAPRCGHHAVSSVVMLVMLAAMAGHGAAGDPWPVLAGHAGAQAWATPVVAVAVYFFVDTAVAGLRAVRSRAGGPTGVPGVFGVRPRESGRALMSAAMAGMLLSML